MPQMDLYIGASQVFWFTVIFLFFYILIVKNILPVLARSIKLRKKKVDNTSVSTLDNEGDEVVSKTASILEGSLRESQSLLSNVSVSSSNWLDSSVKEVNEKTLLDLNKNYIKVIGELKGRSFLIEEVIRQK
jgi:F0F1-type ATP synthase membrane subunit b/b'